MVAVAGTALGVVLFPHLFDIAPLTGPMTMLFIPTLAIDAVAFQLLYRALVPQVAGMAANTPRTVR